MHEGYWTEGHDKEVAFNREKLAKRELEALEERILLPSEIRPTMRDELLDMQIDRAVRDLERVRVGAKRNLQPLQKPLKLRGRRVFVADRLESRKTLNTLFCTRTKQKRQASEPGNKSITQLTRAIQTNYTGLRTEIISSDSAKLKVPVWMARERQRKS